MKKYIIIADGYDTYCTMAENGKHAVMKFLIWMNTKLPEAIRLAFEAMPSNNYAINLYNELYFDNKILFMDEISENAYIDNNEIEIE